MFEPEKVREVWRYAAKKVGIKRVLEALPLDLLLTNESLEYLRELLRKLPPEKRRKLLESIKTSAENTQS